MRSLRIKISKFFVLIILAISYPSWISLFWIVINGKWFFDICGIVFSVIDCLTSLGFLFFSKFKFILLFSSMAVKYFFSFELSVLSLLIILFEDSLLFIVIDIFWTDGKNINLFFGFFSWDFFLNNFLISVEFGLKYPFKNDKPSFANVLFFPFLLLLSFMLIEWLFFFFGKIFCFFLIILLVSILLILFISITSLLLNLLEFADLISSYSLILEDKFFCSLEDIAELKISLLVLLLSISCSSLS